MTNFRAVIFILVIIAFSASGACCETAESPAADDSRIAELIEGLKGWNRDKVQANADALVKVGDPAIPALIAALKNEDPGVRSNAARVLGEIEAKDAAVPLGELLNDPKYWVTRNAVYSLGNIGTPEAVKLLKEALNHYRAQVQEAALWGLDELQEKSAIPEISVLMVSASDQYVRWRAMTVLRSLKEGEEISFLITTLDDPKAEPDRRRNAAVMLGNLEIAAAAPALLKALDAKDAGLRWRAIEALGKIGARDARPAIEARLSDSDGEVRLFAIGALGMLGSEASVKPLQGLLTGNSSEVRMNTIRSLRKIGGPAAAAAISEALTDRDENLRTLAVESLNELGAVDTADKIKLLATDKSPSVRTAVMRALGDLAPDSSREILEAGKTDDNIWVRYEAGLALDKRAGGE